MTWPTASWYLPHDNDDHDDDDHDDHHAPPGNDSVRGACRIARARCVCDKMMRITGQYTSEREQFGRAIATFQAVSHRVADCFIDVECLRLVTQQAASLIDQGRPAGEAVTIAKIWCGDVTHRVNQAAQHCHGGTGVDRDYPLHRYSLLARQIELSAGNSAQLSGQLGEEICASYS